MDQNMDQNSFNSWNTMEENVNHDDDYSDDHSNTGIQYNSAVPDTIYLSTTIKRQMEQSFNSSSTLVQEEVPQKKKPLSKLVLNALGKLNVPTGSSVIAIVKYIKSTNYDVADERLFRKSVHQYLKKAVNSGRVMQVKRSFKLIPKQRNNTKALEKMKNQQKKKTSQNKAKPESGKAPKENGKKRGKRG